MPKIKLIAAIDDKLGLAKNGKIPWDLPSDRAYYRQNITTAPILMGWKTFESNNFKPYISPVNFVLTHHQSESRGVIIIHNLESFISDLKSDLWVVGGGQIFTITLPLATELYLTRVSGNFNCDTFFPDFESGFTLVSKEPPKTENDINFHYEVWQSKSKL